MVKNVAEIWMIHLSLFAISGHLLHFCILPSHLEAEEKLEGDAQVGLGLNGREFWSRVKQPSLHQSWQPSCKTDGTPANNQKTFHWKNAALVCHQRMAFPCVSRTGYRLQMFFFAFGHIRPVEENHMICLL